MQQISYEEAYKELNSIVLKIESGEVTISEVNSLIERGKELINICYNELDKGRGKLSEIKEILGKLEEE